MSYCIYLRKSRADLEAEAHGEGETLARHEKMLLDVAKRGNYDITQIYREIVSGETISARPVVQQLLHEVEGGLWDGVLVVEVERLARGDTIDQGIVAQAFKYSDTKIITPNKVYDPGNEFDEEYFEFGLFMSRREYITIKRRLVRGREAAVKEGKWVPGTCPYGYERVKLDNQKGWTLRPVESEANVVRLIFDLYTNQKDPIGCYAICSVLYDLAIPSPSGKESWDPSQIRNIISNPAYAGKIRWGLRRRTNVVVGGKLEKRIGPKDYGSALLVDGIHPPIISDEVFQRAQARYQVPEHPLNKNTVLRNPLAGVLHCGLCGHTMTMKLESHTKIPRIGCDTAGCPCVSSELEIVEHRILSALSEWCSGYRVLLDCNTALSGDEDTLAVYRKALEECEREQTSLKKQLARAHDLLEQEVYDTETFLERSRVLSDRIRTAGLRAGKIEKEIAECQDRLSKRVEIVPRVLFLLEVYDGLSSAEEKNNLLRGVLERVDYVKEKGGTGRVGKDAFELTIYPRLPKLNE